MDLQLVKSFLELALKSLLFTLVWLPIYLYRCCIILFVKKYKPSLGRILDHMDSTEEENYVDEVPTNALVFTLVLEGSIGLSSLRQLFNRNVLLAKVYDKKSGQDLLRYPELKQYQAGFGGYVFWKNDDKFQIAHHVMEEPFSEKFTPMARLHQEVIHEKFQRRRSPWKITLIKNYENDRNKTVLVFHCHHTLGDALSFIKLLVEGLGQKSFKMSNAQYSRKSWPAQLKYYALLPFYFVYVQLLAQLKTKECDDKSDWIRDWNRDPHSKQNISISSKIPLSDIKTIAKANNVTASAVIMAAVIGGVAKVDKRLARSPMPVHWVLPKRDHPDVLVNHLYSRIKDLPTDISSPLERLRKCNEAFLELKSSTLPEYAQMVTFQHGTLFSLFRLKFSIQSNAPLIISNIASDGEGFSVGGLPCSEFLMTSGAYRAVICPFSYKDSIQISATIKDSILKEEQTRELVALIQKEFVFLRAAST